MNEEGEEKEKEEVEEKKGGGGGEEDNINIRTLPLVRWGGAKVWVVAGVLVAQAEGSLLRSPSQSRW